MSYPTIEQEISVQLAKLPNEHQLQVLEFTKELSAAACSHSSGTKGSSMLALVGSIGGDDLVAMQTAIDADCEQIDSHGW